MYKATGCPVLGIYLLVAVQLAPDRPALPALGARAEDEAAVSTLERTACYLAALVAVFVLLTLKQLRW